MENLTRKTIVALMVVLISASVCFGGQLILNWTGNTAAKSYTACYAPYSSNSNSFPQTNCLTVTAPVTTVTFQIPTADEGVPYYSRVFATYPPNSANISVQSVFSEYFLGFFPVAPTQQSQIFIP